jgi:membrane protease YdiL (CAAX protease family)
MRRMKQSLGGFRAALLAGWIMLGAVGWLYARWKGIPAWAAVPILAAFLLEYPFYLGAGFAAVRERWGRPWVLVASFVAPYFVYAAATGQLRGWALVQLAALATGLSLWYKVLAPVAIADAAFLVLVAAVVLRGYLTAIYTSPLAGVHLDILGHLALIRLCAIVMLVERRVSGTNFGFLPNAQEWWTGFRHFLYFLIAGIPLAWATGLVHAGAIMPPWKIGATFLGVLWVVALGEEFFFRGLLQHWLSEWTGSQAAALIIASIVFGSAHHGFRGFPNWRFALAAAVAGWFYGRAYAQAKSIRASMVIHALVVTAWRVFSG